jgi:hypothetical protein
MQLQITANGRGEFNKMRNLVTAGWAEPFDMVLQEGREPVPGIKITEAGRAALGSWRRFEGSAISGPCMCSHGGNDNRGSMTMPMARKQQTRTFHPLEVAKSIEEQSNKVGILLGAVESILSLHPDLPGGEILRRAADECRAAMYPEHD